jgi:DNA-binding transcriptional MerR regulator
MNVSELARRAGIAPSAVRFYERKGILPPPPRGPNGYREYGAEDLCRVRVVASLRRLGLELVEAGRLATLCAAGQCEVMSHDLVPLIARQRAAIERNRAEIEVLDGQLAALQAALSSDIPDPDLCLEGGGESGTARYRPGLSVPVPVPARLPVLSR